MTSVSRCQISKSEKIGVIKFFFWVFKFWTLIYGLEKYKILLLVCLTSVNTASDRLSSSVGICVRGQSIPPAPIYYSETKCQKFRKTQILNLIENRIYHIQCPHSYSQTYTLHPFFHFFLIAQSNGTGSKLFKFLCYSIRWLKKNENTKKKKSGS